MFLLLALACDLELEPASPGDTSVAYADDTASDCVGVDPEASFFYTLTIDGLYLTAVVDAVCVSADGTSVEVTFHVEGGEEGSIVYSGNPQGTYNLPPASGSLVVTYGDRTWESTDWLSGYVSQYDAYGELSGTAYDADSGANLVIGLVWGDPPVVE